MPRSASPRPTSYERRGSSGSAPGLEPQKTASRRMRRSTRRVYEPVMHGSPQVRSTPTAHRSDRSATSRGLGCHHWPMVQVIGAGFGRTGTLSTKAALEHLTGGRCYHMFEALAHPEHLPAWLAAADGHTDGLRAVLADYTCTVDW